MGKQKPRQWSHPANFTYDIKQRIKSTHAQKEKKAVFTNLHFIFKYYWNKSPE